MRILRRIFNRRVGLTLFVVLLVVTVAIMVNLVGIQLAGDIPSWDLWLKSHAAAFFFWRLCLYAATIYGWLWMRKRVLQRNPAPGNRKRILRAEICAIGAIVLLEVSNGLA